MQHDDEENDSRDRLHRRALLLAVPGFAALPACQGSKVQPALEREPASATPSSIAAAQVLSSFPLGSPPWKTFDPFLFCVHHKDDYPQGNDAMGPRAPLDGRNLGSDFAGKDGWSMYHGEVVPGFPRHPHRGFETVTVTRRGYIDHSDSLGATARYGDGDVQWMTAGAGICHAEMFPLLEREQPNPAELFQIWINLPSVDKFARPHFSMFWNGSVPRREFRDPTGKTTRVTVVAGTLAGARPPQPPPNSWASRDEAEVAIWSIRMAPGARWELPPASAGVQRTLYFFAGESLTVAQQPQSPGVGLVVRPDVATPLSNGDAEAEILLLQGRPIGEPVVKHGPFVMNTREQIQQAISDYRRTQFGGWPWPDAAPVHARNQGRFAVHADGRREQAG